MKRAQWPAVLAAVLLSTATHAKDERSMQPLADTLNSDVVKKARDPGIRIYFGKQAHAKVEKSFGETSMRRSTTVDIMDQPKACQHAFARAMQDFQERARAAGANAVINVRSDYKNVEIASDSEYMCGAGTWAVGVAFKGELVKLAE